METKKNISFKSINITNFKGIKSLSFEFSDINTISGANGTGKSTIFDAILWNLFGKNSQDEKDFSIKNTVDISMNRAEHVVELILTTGRSDISLKRVYKEVWTKKRGAEEAEFTGHETLYFWDGSPLMAKEYAAKISEISPEQLFRQLTNPVYITLIMKWMERRLLFESMVNVTDEKVINGTVAFRDLFASIEKGLTLEEKRKKIAYDKASIKKLLPQYGPRIDEVLRTNPEIQDWAAIEKEIKAKQDVILVIEKEISDISLLHEKDMAGIKAKQAESIAARRKMGDIENELSKKAYAEAGIANKELIEAKYNLGQVRDQLKYAIQTEKDTTTRAINLESKLKNLREKYEEQNAKVFIFDSDQCICYACRQQLPTVSGNEEFEQKNIFNTQILQAKALLNKEGIPMGQEKKELLLNLATLVNNILELKLQEDSMSWAADSKMEDPKPIDLTKNTQYQSLKKVAEEVFEVKRPDVAEQLEMKASIQDGISDLNALLKGRDIIGKNKARIDDLKAEEKKYAKDLAELEKQEFTIELFYKAKSDLVTASVNALLPDDITIIMYESQINGGETPCCKVMINGVPFSDANHAGQINAGVKLINVISDYYGISAPLVIDNAEAINTVAPTYSQLIKLAVSDDKKLVFTNN